MRADCFEGEVRNAVFWVGRGRILWTKMLRGRRGWQVNQRVGKLVFLKVLRERSWRGKKGERGPGKKLGLYGEGAKRRRVRETG